MKSVTVCYLSLYIFWSIFYSIDFQYQHNLFSTDRSLSNYIFKSFFILSPLAVRPRFTQPSKMRKRVIARPVGSSVRLKCTASGNPRPDIVWLKDSRPLVDEDSGAGGEEGKKKRWTLSLKNLTPEHSGKYTCHVSNRAGQINATYKLEVIRESPFFMLHHCKDVDRFLK